MSVTDTSNLLMCLGSPLFETVKNLDMADWALTDSSSTDVDSNAIKYFQRTFMEQMESLEWSAMN